MKCPACTTALHMSERAGIEIDFCPSCRGVWLDRGELDKIIEKSALPNPVAATPMAQRGMPAQHGGYQKPHHKRRKSFLEELFD